MTRKTRLIALIVSVVMLIGMLPLSLFAEDSAVVAEASEESTVTLKGVSASLGAETALNYYIAADEAVANGLTANFTVGEKTESVKLSAGKKTASGIKVSCGLSAIELSKTVTFTLTDSEGKTVEFLTSKGAQTEYTYSVKAYATDLIASDGVDELKAAAKSLLLYGYFAETYFAGVAPTSFEGVLTAADIAAVSDSEFGAGSVEIENTLVGDSDVLGSVYLVLDSYAKIRIEVKGEEAPVVASTDADVKVVNIDGKYYVDVIGIDVSDFNKVYTFTVNDTTVSISLLAIANIVANDAETYGDAFVNLAKALYNYHDSIYAYANRNFVVKSEDYTDSTINFASGKVNDINYYQNKATVLYLTENGYLKVNLTAGSDYSQGAMAVRDLGYTIPDHGATVISYQIAFSKIEGVDLPTSVKVQAPFKNNDPREPILFGFGPDGSIILGETGTLKAGESKTIGYVTEGEFTTVRVAVDFVNGTVTAYDEEFNVIAVVGDIDNWVSYDEIDRQYHFFLRAYNSTADSTAGYLMDDLKVVEGNVFEAPQIGSTINSIHYETNGGTFTEEAPITYDPLVGVLLPTKVTRKGYEFGGWYTSADFSGERVYYVAPGDEGRVTVYAKWNYVVLSEDYSETVINTTGTVDDANNIKYSVGQGLVTHKTENGSLRVEVDFDTVNNKRAKTTWTVQSLGTAKDRGATVLSYQMSFKKVEGVSLPYIIEMALPFKSSNPSTNRIFGIDSTGAITLQNGDLTQGESTLIGTVTEDGFTTVRLAVDLVNGLITAYDDNLDIIAQIKTTDTNFPYYDQTFRNYHLWLSIGQKGVTNTSDPELVPGAVLYDNLIIADGNMFEKTEVELPSANDIIYNAGVGTLPEDAPTEYDAAVDTVLPVLTKDGYIFNGWYTTATFKAGTRVEKIAAGTNGPVTLYAKWNYVVLSEDYSETVIDTTGTVDVNNITYGASQGGVAHKTEDGSLRVDLSFNAKRAKTTWTVKTLGTATANGATVLSYQMSFKKVEGVALPNIIEMALPFKSSNYSLNRIFGIDNTGAITLQNGTLTQGESTLIGTVTEDAFTTVRLTVDLVTGLITAYDDNFDIIAQIKTTDEGFPYYDQTLRAYHLWFSAGQATSATASDPAVAFLFDDLIIAEGNIFE